MAGGKAVVRDRKHPSVLGCAGKVGCRGRKLHTLTRRTRPSDRETEREADERIADALSVLTDRERTVFHRVTVNGERHHTIAKDLGVSRQAVTKIMSTVKWKLVDYRKNLVAE